MQAHISDARCNRAMLSNIVGFLFGSSVLLVGLWYVFFYLSENSGRVLDDAYITYTYALNLSEGAGLRYNPGDALPTEGGTSFFHIVLVAGGLLFGLDPLTLTRALGIAAFFGTALGMAYTVRHLTGIGRGLALAAAAIPTAIVLMLPETVGHLAKGMETMLFWSLHMGLILWAMLAIHNAPRQSMSMILVGAFLALCLGLTRPEGMPLAAAIIGLAALCSAVKTGRLRIWDAKASLIAGILFSLGAGAFLFWKVNYFGDVLPNAYWVKANNKIFGSTETFLPGFSDAAAFLAMRWVPFALVAGLLLIFAAPRLRPNLPYLLLCLPALGIAVLYAKAIHEVAGGFRYGYPMLPPVFAIGGVALAMILKTYPHRGLAGLAVGLCTLVVMDSGKNSDPLQWAKKPQARALNWVAYEPTDGPLQSLALDLKDTGLREDATIYLSAAGFIPYISRFRAIDWIGLNNNTLSGEKALSLDEVWTYIRSTQPDVIQTIVPPASPGSTSRFEDAAFNSKAVKDLLRGRVVLFYHWDRERIEEMLWREMVWIRDHAVFGACYELKGDWTLMAYVLKDSPHADTLLDTLQHSSRAACDRATAREMYASDPFGNADAQRMVSAPSDQPGQHSDAPGDEEHADGTGQRSPDVLEFLERHKDGGTTHPDEIHDAADKADHHQAPATSDTIYSVMEPHDDAALEARSPVDEELKERASAMRQTPILEGGELIDAGCDQKSC